VVKRGVDYFFLPKEGENPPGFVFERGAGQGREGGKILNKASKREKKKTAEEEKRGRGFLHSF